MSVLRKIQRALRGRIAKVIFASMVGVATVFGMVHSPTQAMIIEPPRIEMSYNVQSNTSINIGYEYDGKDIDVIVVDSEDDIPEEARKNHTQMVQAPSKDSIWDKAKGWLKDHPIKNADSKLDEIKQRVQGELNSYSERTKQAIQDGIDSKINTFKEDLLKDLIEGTSNMFKFVMNGIIILPIDLVTNEALRNLYLKLLVVAVGLIAVFAVYNCLMAIVSEDNYVGFSFMIGRIFKAILLMMLSVIYIPLFVMWTNTVSEGILSLTMKQVEMNIFIRMVEEGTLVSVAGTVGAIIMTAMLLIFLFQIFLHTCSRYWEVCKLFCMAPLALSMSIVPSQDYIYISWRSKLKHVFFIQILYALHIAIFVAIMSVPFESTWISLMIFIGGIWDLTKLPTGLDDIFRANPNKTYTFGKHLISNLIAKKVPVAKVAEKVKVRK